MSCDHQRLAQYVCEYIEGTLPPALRRRCEADLAACEHCRQVHEHALDFQRLASRWEPVEVPAWNRVKHAVRPKTHPSPWLSWGALAASCLALVLVVLRLEVSLDDGLLISMGGRQAEARVIARLTEELEAWRTASEVALETRLTDFAATQSTANQLALAQWLEESRSERRRDIEFLMAAWQSQRFQDQRQIDERLSYLADNQIESNTYLNELLRTVRSTSRGNL